MLQGLSTLPPRRRTIAGGTSEFDLDAALARRPALIPTVDELAHSNARLRHQSTGKDVDELLEARIDVFTTVGAFPASGKPE